MPCEMDISKNGDELTIKVEMLEDSDDWDESVFEFTATEGVDEIVLEAGENDSFNYNGGYLTRVKGKVILNIDASTGFDGTNFSVIEM